MAAASNDSEKWHGSSTRTQKDEGAGIGETLRVARERLGLTLEQVARETRIPLRHLDALEHDNLAALPGPFYQRAEIRTYALALKLDPNLVLARLDRGTTPTVLPAKSAEPPGVHKFDRSRRHVGFIVAGVVLTALALWRTMPRSAPLDGSAQVGRDAGSITPDMPSPDNLVTHVAVEVHRPEFDQTPQSSASTERVAPIRIEATESRPAAEAQGSDRPTIVKPADERRPAGVATELVVATEPEGARVTVDGIGWGVTPVTIRHLSPGNKRIRVSKDGYATTERVVSVVDGQRKTTHIPLSTEP